MARTDLKKDDDLWYDTWNDADVDNEDEFPGGSLVNGYYTTVHAPDVEVEYNDDTPDLQFGVQKHQYNAYDSVSLINDEEYMANLDGDRRSLADHLENMRRWGRE